MMYWSALSQSHESWLILIVERDFPEISLSSQKRDTQKRARDTRFCLCCTITQYSRRTVVWCTPGWDRL